MASQACTFVDFLISFTTFSAVPNTCSLGTERKSRPAPALPGKGHLHPAAPGRRHQLPYRNHMEELGHKLLYALCIYIGDQLFFLLPFAPEVAAPLGQAQRAPRSCPRAAPPAASPGRGCAGPTAHPVFPLNLPRGSIASFILFHLGQGRSVGMQPHVGQP